MKKSPARKEPNFSLRRKAEKKLEQQTDRLRDLSKNDMEQLIHELGTHQIELEMQNEDLRQAQVALDALHRRYADLYDFAPVGYFIFDGSGLILEANLAGANILGVSKRLLVNKPFSLFIEGIEDRKSFSAHLSEVLQRQTKGTCELRLKEKDGTKFYAQLQSIPAEDSEGNLSLIRTALSDITERKQAEESLHIKDSAIATAINGIAFADLQGNLTYVNQAFLDMWGYGRADDVLGRHARDFWQSAEGALDVIEALGREGQWSGEMTAKRRDGTPFFVLVFASLVRNDKGVPLCMMASFSDITERKRAEEEIRRLNEELRRNVYELEAVNRDLDAFSYTVSNDLKAPLRSIEGFTRAVLEDYRDKLDDVGRDYLMRAHSASNRMSQLIEAMLTISRLTKGELRERNVNLSDKVGVIAHELKRQDPQRNVEFVIAERVKAKGDDAMLQIVLENLLDNAWKFTGRHPSAKIEFGVAQKDGSNIYFVRDDGVGFDMQYADKLFMPFQRLHSADEFPGLGIGLATVQRIINRHGGKIWAEGEVGKGATFYFTLG